MSYQLGEKMICVKKGNQSFDEVGNKGLFIRHLPNGKIHMQVNVENAHFYAWEYPEDCWKSEEEIK